MILFRVVLRVHDLKPFRHVFRVGVASACVFDLDTYFSTDNCHLVVVLVFDSIVCHYVY